jgi:hypothetical protein
MNVGLLMILKWGEATANKISFGDCEANQDQAENVIRRQVPGRVFAHRYVPFNENVVGIITLWRILRRLVFGPISDER